MDRQPFFWFVFLIACGVIVYINWQLVRDCPADRSAIDKFAGQRGWRIISVTRSYNFFRYFFIGISAGNAVRFYETVAEDAEGNRGDILVGFDSLFGPGQLVVLEQQGLVLTPPSGLVSVRRPGSGTHLSHHCCELLLLFVAGVGFGSGLFCVILGANLSPTNRPELPEASLGYTHLFQARHGEVYGTFFEYLAVTYGVSTMTMVAALSGLLLKIGLKTRVSLRWQVFLAAAISMVLCYTIWRLSIYAARS